MILILYNLALLPILSSSEFSAWSALLLLTDLAGMLWLGVCFYGTFTAGIYLSESTCSFRSLTLKKRVFEYKDISTVLLLPQTLPVGAFDAVLHLNAPIYVLFLMSEQPEFRHRQWEENLHLGSYGFQVNFGGDCLGYALYHPKLLSTLLLHKSDLKLLSPDCIPTP